MGGLPAGVPREHSAQEWPNPMGGKARQEQCQSSWSLDDVTWGGSGSGMSSLVKTKPGSTNSKNSSRNFDNNKKNGVPVGMQVAYLVGREHG